METTLPVEHPADYRKDARLVGHLTVSQVAGATLAVIGGCLLELYLVLTAARTGWHVLAWLLILGVVLQVTWDLFRRISLVIQYGVRPHARRADASRVITTASEETVQDLIKVQAAEGPLVAFLDGSLAMVLQMAPGPVRCLSAEQHARLCRRLEQALLDVSETGVEMTVYLDLEPDLNRPEMDRQMEQLATWPEASGLRRLIGARMEHHWRLAYEEARRSTYHIRLSLQPDKLPQAGHEEDQVARAKRAADYLRKVGRSVAEELGGEGVRVMPLAPEALRDLATRQLDPAGWRQAEPVAGTAWQWPVDSGPVVHSAAIEEEIRYVKVGLPPVQVAAPAVLQETPAATVVEPIPEPAQPPAPVLTEALMGEGVSPAPASNPLPEEWPWTQTRTTGDSVGECASIPLSSHGYPIGYYPRRLTYRTPTGRGLGR